MKKMMPAWESQISIAMKSLEWLIWKDLSWIVEILWSSKDKEILLKARQDVRAILDGINIAIIRTFMFRQEFMGLIAASKKEWDPILQLEREWEVIKNAGNIAKESGEDEQYTEMLVWMITAAAKEKQRKILGRDSVFIDEGINTWVLRNNAIELRDSVAESYEKYGVWFDSTQLAQRNERRQLLDLIRMDEQRWSAISLMSADGSIWRILVNEWFKKVQWLDISPKMIKVSRSLALSEWETYDLFEPSLPIPVEEASTDLVIADFWAASELDEHLLSEVKRVLKPGGKAYLSYYNSDAFAHTWWQPWQTSIEAILNTASPVLEVPLIDTETWKCKSYKIYAQWRSYDSLMSELKKLWLFLVDVSSFPLLSTLMPPTFFTDESRVKEAIEYDLAHSRIAPYKGYYLSLIIRK